MHFLSSNSGYRESELILTHLLPTNYTDSSLVNPLEEKITTFIRSKFYQMQLSLDTRSLNQFSWSERDLNELLMTIDGFKEELISSSLAPKLIHFMLRNKNKDEIETICNHLKEKYGIDHSLYRLVDFTGKSLLYGNKAANLYQLQNIAVVPPFIALAHEEMKAYLKSALPQVETLWNDFIQLQNNQTSSLTPSAKIKLAEIEVLIINHFKNNYLANANLLSFLTHHPEAALMVRSTGKEDSDLQANPGGNKSIAAVPSNIQAISCAMGEVVASYFSEKSMEQRLLSGDDILAPPFLPVLVQVMIGEKIGGVDHLAEIPFAGVIYTQEMEGMTPDLIRVDVAFGHNEGVVAGTVDFDTLYLGDKDIVHRIISIKKERVVPVNTDDTEQRQLVKKQVPKEMQQRSVMTIKQRHRLKEIAREVHKYYGKPMDIEWVFDPVKDTFYLVQARPIVSKAKRVEPGIVDVTKMRQPQQIQGTTIISGGGNPRVCVSRDEVIMASTVALALDKYLANKDKSKIKAVICLNMAPATSHEAGMFREAGVAILRITDKALVKAWEEDPQFLSKEFLIVDTQQELLIKGSREPYKEAQDSQVLEYQLKQEGVLRSGWHHHPIQGQESIPNINLSSNDIKELWSLLEISNIELDEIKKYNTTSLKGLLKIIGEGQHENSAEAKLALKAFLRRIYFKTAQTQKTEGESARLVNLFKHTLIVADAIKSAKNRMQRLHAMKRLETVLYQPADNQKVGTDSIYQWLQEEHAERKVDKDKKIMRGVFLSKQVTKNFEDNAIHIYSLEDSLGRVSLSEAESKTYLTQYSKLNKIVLDPDIKADWAEFTTTIARTQSSVANGLLGQLIVDFEKQKLLSLWLNTSFVSAWEKVKKEEATALDCLALLLEEKKASSYVIETIKQKREILSYWEKKIANWETVSNYPSLWQQFQEEFVANLLDPSLSEKVSNPKTDRLSKLLILKYVQETVEVYDQTIKSMKNSPNYTDLLKGTQCFRFHEMLTPYFTLMKTWVEIIPEEQFRAWTDSIQSFTTKRDMIQMMNRKFSILGLLASGLGKMASGDLDNIDEWEKGQLKWFGSTNIENIRQNISRNCPRILAPSKDFSVGAAKMGSGAAFERQFNQRENVSSEDIFSLIHQNLNTALAYFQIPNGISSQHIHAQLKTIVSQLVGPKMQLLNLGYQYPQLDMEYNIPLRNHSGNLKISQNVETAALSIKFELYGYNFGNRMNLIAEYALAESETQNWPLNETATYDGERNVFHVGWNWDAKEMQHKEALYFTKIGAAISKMGEMTMI